MPTHLQDSNRDGDALGHGEGYAYPHDHPGHHVGQQYLPEGLLGRTFYQPSREGYEAEVALRLGRWRAAQQAALGRPPAERTAQGNETP